MFLNDRASRDRILGPTSNHSRPVSGLPMFSAAARGLIRVSPRRTIALFASSAAVGRNVLLCGRVAQQKTNFSGRAPDFPAPCRSRRPTAPPR